MASPRGAQQRCELTHCNSLQTVVCASAGVLVVIEFRPLGKNGVIHVLAERKLRKKYYGKYYFSNSTNESALKKQFVLARAAACLSD